MAPTAPTTSRKLKAWRQKKGWTLADLAKASGVDSAILCHLEMARRIPSLPQAFALAAVTAIAPAEWLPAKRKRAA